MEVTDRILVAQFQRQKRKCEFRVATVVLVQLVIYELGLMWYATPLYAAQERIQSGPPLWRSR